MLVNLYLYANIFFFWFYFHRYYFSLNVYLGFANLQINYLVGTRGGLSGYLFECMYLPLPETGFDECLMTPDSVLEPAGSVRTSSGSGGCGGVDCKTTLACTATTEVVRKKRSACRPVGPVCHPVHEISAGLMNRRKGTPHRAPLHWMLCTVMEEGGGFVGKMKNLCYHVFCSSHWWENG